MITATAARSGKTHHDENFPVASKLLHPQLRGPILAYYRFARAADDVADHCGLGSAEKLTLLDKLEAALLGDGPPDPEAEPLRLALAERQLSRRHALDLLQAFRLDVRKSRYANWDELMGYCMMSAAPVGRFVLEVHGEAPEATWPASDRICMALQVINHLQDCQRDYRNLDRVYLPLDLLATHGVGIEALAAASATPGLRACIADLAGRASELLRDGAALPRCVADTRLSLEIAVIHRLAGTLAAALTQRDPLSQHVKLGKATVAVIGFASAAGMLARRWVRIPVPWRFTAGSRQP
jgi:squalene synthase HpnC